MPKRAEVPHSSNLKKVSIHWWQIILKGDSHSNLVIVSACREHAWIRRVPGDCIAPWLMGIQSLDRDPRRLMPDTHQSVCAYSQSKALPNSN